MTSAISLLQAARDGGYALAAFNAVNLETAQAIVQAAELERAPVVLQVSENAARYGGLKPLFGLCKALQQDAEVPIVLHYDHAESLDSAMKALELGFDSVMLEGGDLGIEENAEQLRVLSNAAHARGGMVEGEFEIVGKDGREGDRLTPQALVRLAELASCDSVAIDIGSRHKMTSKGARLDLERLEDIARQLAQPLVLHGSSGVEDRDLRAASRLGISKVNIATELMLVFTRGTRKGLVDETVYDPRVYLKRGRACMTERARHFVRLLGGGG